MGGLAKLREIKSMWKKMPDTQVSVSKLMTEVCRTARAVLGV